MQKRPPPKKRPKAITAVMKENKPEPAHNSKKDESLIIKILGEIEIGMNPDRACMLHDLDRTSWYRWRVCEKPQPEGINEQGLEKSIDDRRCWNCNGCNLQKRCDNAREKYVRVHHKKVAEATIKGEDVWTASAWLLERTEPDRYANKTKQEITHTLNAGGNNAQKLVNAVISAAISGK